MLVIRSPQELLNYLKERYRMAVKQLATYTYSHPMNYAFEESIIAVEAYIKYLEENRENPVDSESVIAYNKDRDEYELGGES